MHNILEVKDLFVHYKTVDGLIAAVNGVNLAIKEGSTVGLVGETGAGKTTLAKSIMQLLPQPPAKVDSGEIFFKGEDILKRDQKKMTEIRGKQISMIFQDPMTSLNPIMTIGEQIAEVIKQHEKLSDTGTKKKAREMLELVGIPSIRAGEYAHQFSGGMKQRVVIAIALACNPVLLIADEPTTALDVTIQAQLLELMAELQKKMNTSMLLITHDLGVVAQNCEYVAIMYAGEIVEYGKVHDVFKNSKHPYTIGLFESIPKLNEDVVRLKPIDGLMPNPTSLPTGCKFNERCKKVFPLCFTEHPMMKLSNEAEHYVRCFLYKRAESCEATNVEK